MRVLRVAAAVIICLTGALLSTSGSAAQQSAVQSNVQVNALGESIVGTPPVGKMSPGAPDFAREMHRRPKDERFGGLPGPLSSVSGTPAMRPDPRSQSITISNPGFVGFNGLTHRDQRLADNGNQFSTEPPDQALCVGNGFVVEGVNTALAVYSEGGRRLAGPTSMNRFFGLASEIVRDPLTFGPFLADPRCLFDSATNRFYVLILEIGVDPATGDFLPQSSLLIAASKTGDPTAGFNLFELDITAHGDFGMTGPNRCPCFGDQPLLGANADGLFVSTNSFSLITGGFAGAQVYAISKALLTGGAGSAVRFSNLVVAGGGLAASIQPAAAPPTRRDDGKGRNTEFFASAFNLDEDLQNQVVVWALKGTSTLRSARPRLRLTNRVIGSQAYAIPPNATQKAGPTPLADLLGEPELMLSTNDHRMQQVTYAEGQLYGAITTAVGTGTDQRSGIAFFVIDVESNEGRLKAKVATQGYVSLARHFLHYPSFVPTSDGGGVIAFSFSGPDHFPSVGYVHVNGDGRAGRIHIAAAGTAPDDGFSGYVAFGGDGTGRWGDYSAAAVSQDGSIWFASEYIPNTPRTLLANWGTFVGRIRVDDDGN